MKDKSKSAMSANKNRTKDKSEGYVVPMSKAQKSEWEGVVKQGKDISSGKVTPAYLKDKRKKK